jgi:CCR4-NOT transcriptional complex subunit CAF120
MASSGGGSTSPQWDNRNCGFVTPAQFEQSQRDLQEFPRSPPPGQGQGQLQQQQSQYPQGQPQDPQQQQQQHQYLPAGQQLPQGQPLYPEKQSQDPQRPTSPLNPNSLAPSLHPEISSIVQLAVTHARKVYFSGPLIRKIERNADGQKPAKDEGWQDVWAQVGGTTLSIWDMKQVEEASKNGKEIPPTHVNVTDAVRPNIYIR